MCFTVSTFDQLAELEIEAMLQEVCALAFALALCGSVLADDDADIQADALDRAMHSHAWATHRYSDIIAQQ